jgi:hypothetical protein
LSLSNVPLAEVERRMRPGQYSLQGFIGEQESLKEVLDTDALALQKLGLTAPELAWPLRTLLETTIEAKTETLRIEPFRVRLHRYKGTQVCPFAPQPYDVPCPGGAAWMGSFDWDIHNERSGVHLKGPGLIVHLILAHGFFEGVHSPYRVEPEDLAKLFGLGPFQTTNK